MFRQMIFLSLTVGLLAGILLSVGQQVLVAPIIYAAEQFESLDPVHAEPGSHHHTHHAHSETAWEPETQNQRVFFSIISNIFGAIGYAAILLALMAQMQQQSITQITLPKGFLWGIAGFLVFFALPGVGLPPEIPGIEAAALEHRQQWWLLTVTASGIGLLLIAFAKWPFKVLGCGLLFFPYLIGAPGIVGPEFSHPDAVAVERLHQLHQQFIFTSSLVNFVFWFALGGLCAWLLSRSFIPNPLSKTNTEELTIRESG